MTFGGTFSPASLFYYSTGVLPGTAPSESGGTDRALPHSVVLDGYTFALDLSKSEISAQDTFRDSVTSDAVPNDTLFNARGAWGRYMYSLHHGAGQNLSDLDPDADSYRFESSYDVVWEEKFQATLRPRSVKQWSTTGSNIILCRSGNEVYAGDGTVLRAVLAGVTLTAPGGTIQAMCTDGTDLFVATSTGLVRYLNGATVPTAFATPVVGNCTNVAFASGRVLLAKANALYEVPGSGVLAAPIKTHYQAAFTWSVIFNVGSRIYVGGYAGSRSELYSLTTTDLGALALSAEAAPFPVDELLQGGVSTAGIVLLATNRGVRTAELTGDGSLTYGPLVTAPGDVRAVCTDGQYGFFTWSVIDPNRSGVGRMALDIDVQPLQPAYGTDVSEQEAQATVTGVARYQGVTYFAVAGNGVWYAPTTAFEGQGSFSTGSIAFGTVEPKALIALSATFQPLRTGESIEINVFDEFGVRIGTGVQNTIDATALEIDLGGESVPFCTVETVMLGPTTTTPTFLRWRLRAYPIPPAVEQFVLALVLREKVRVNGDRGQDVSYKIDSMYSWIESLWSNRRYTLLRMGTRSYRVRVENFKLLPTEWNTHGELPTGILVVQLVAA